MFSSLKRWMLRSVVSVKRKAEIVAAVWAKYQVENNSKKFVGRFQKVLTEFIGDMTEDDLRLFEDMAEKWNQDGVSAEMKNS